MLAEGLAELRLRLPHGGLHLAVAGASGALRIWCCFVDSSNSEEVQGHWL